MKIKRIIVTISILVLLMSSSLSFINAYASSKPKNTKITSVSVLDNGNSIELKWKKVSGISGYQIQYSLRSNYKNKKKMAIKNSNRTKKTIKNVFGGEYYYFRIRTYKQTGKKKLYSKWKKFGINTAIYDKNIKKSVIVTVNYKELTTKRKVEKSTKITQATLTGTTKKQVATSKEITSVTATF